MRLFSFLTVVALAACGEEDRSRFDGGPQGDARAVDAVVADAAEIDAGVDAGDASGIECFEVFASECRAERRAECQAERTACLATGTERVCDERFDTCVDPIAARCDACRCTECAGMPRSECVRSECLDACTQIRIDEATACNVACYGNVDAGNRPIFQACTADPADTCGCCAQLSQAQTACNADPCGRVALLVSTGTITCSAQ